jgi:hypothetical protein
LDADDLPERVVGMEHDLQHLEGDVDELGTKVRDVNAKFVELRSDLTSIKSMVRGICVSFGVFAVITVAILDRTGVLEHIFKFRP